METSGLIIRYTGDAYGCDDQKIKRCRPNNGAGTEVPSIETIPENFNNREKDFRCTGPKSHESQISNGVVPDSDFHFLDTAWEVRVGYLQFFSPTRNDFNGNHEDVCDNGDGKETPE